MSENVLDAKGNPRNNLFLADGLHPSYSGIQVMMNSLIAFQTFAQYGKLNLNPHTLPKPEPTPASTPLHPTSTSPAGDRFA